MIQTSLFAITPSQQTVTQSMTKPMEIAVVMRNNGQSDVDLGIGASTLSFAPIGGWMRTPRAQLEIAGNDILVADIVDFSAPDDDGSEPDIEEDGDVDRGKMVQRAFSPYGGEADTGSRDLAPQRMAMAMVGLRIRAPRTGPPAARPGVPPPAAR